MSSSVELSCLEFSYTWLLYVDVLISIQPPFGIEQPLHKGDLYGGFGMFWIFWCEMNLQHGDVKRAPKSADVWLYLSC